MALAYDPLFISPDKSLSAMDVASPPLTILTQDELKRIAAYKAVEFVESDMVLGLGTGGSKLTLPVEIIPLCWKLTAEKLRKLLEGYGCEANLRLGDIGFFSSSGNTTTSFFSSSGNSSTSYSSSSRISSTSNSKGDSCIRV